ncbi:MAG: 4-hydroxy-3-methylbut-2-enyl diphosphate reductase [Deltaproteobacteria bacterium]|nr:MAG: 4-hydroxy-3-methylbut-2-enyl diphosphate reductase [Deltaproteobacteria bacterium]
MKVKVAKTAGFCMGVRRALELVLARSLRDSGPIYTYGPLIHNNQVVELLESKGIKTINNLDEFDELHSGTIVIRAHGIPPDEKEEITKKGLNILDATCPKVARVQGIIKYYTGKGYSAIIVGDRGHAEVKGLVGYSKGPVYVIQKVEDVERLPHMEKVIVVAQTTQNKIKYREITGALEQRFPDARIFNTICDATNHRQEEVRKLARDTDCIVVVGGYHSGNTKRLVQVAKEAGAKVFHVETEMELNREELSKANVIGVTAGASTPNWIIKKVVNEIEGIKKGKSLGIIHILKQISRFLLISNITVALGAASLSYAYLVLSKLEPDIVYPLLSFLYVYAMHGLNLLLDRGASVYNDPHRATFLMRNRNILLITSVSSVFVGLFLAYTMGMTAFLFIVGLCILGVIYSIPIFPEGIKRRYGYYRIKDIPGSRSLSEAIGWASVVSIFPILGNKCRFSIADILAAVVVFMLSYTRSLLFDIFQTQGDLIVGTETLPITIGEKKTLFIIKSLLSCLAIILLIAGLINVFPCFSYVMLVPSAGLFLCIMAYERKWLYLSTSLEMFVELNFLITGALAVLTTSYGL